MTDVQTGYSKQLVDYTNLTCIISLEQNYTNYDLFVLKNLLQQFLLLKYKKSYQIYITGEESGTFSDSDKNQDQKTQSFEIKFFFNDGIENIILNDQQKEEIESTVKSIRNKNNSHLLIYSFTSTNIDNKHYSELLIRKFLPYVSISSKYQPVINTIGLYVDLRDEINYLHTYQELIRNINLQISDMYHRGVICNPPGNVIKNWNLIKYQPDIEMNTEFKENNEVNIELNTEINTNTLLYEADWKDDRLIQKYGTMLQFLTTRLHNDKYIHLKIGSNNVIRHHVALLAKKFDLDCIFETEYVKLSIDNLKLTQQIMTLITNCVTCSAGEVFILTYSRPYNLIVNESIVNDLKTKLKIIIDSIGYKVSDQDNEYVFSVQIVINSNYEYVRQLIVDYRQDVLNYMSELKENNPSVIISEKLGGEYQNISLYELIEQKWITNIPKLNLEDVLI